jgi:hypothetical protein
MKGVRSPALPVAVRGPSSVAVPVLGLVDTGADYSRATVQEREIELSATFSNTPVVLLGREDFLQHFEVTVDQRGRRFTLRSY